MFLPIFGSQVTSGARGAVSVGLCGARQLSPFWGRRGSSQRSIHPPLWFMHDSEGCFLLGYLESNRNHRPEPGPVLQSGMKHFHAGQLSFGAAPSRGWPWLVWLAAFATETTNQIATFLQIVECRCGNGICDPPRFPDLGFGGRRHAHCGCTSTSFSTCPRPQGMYFDGHVANVSTQSPCVIRGLPWKRKH